jgi:hypothetical protein
MAVTAEQSVKLIFFFSGRIFGITGDNWGDWPNHEFVKLRHLTTVGFLVITFGISNFKYTGQIITSNLEAISVTAYWFEGCTFQAK